MQQSAHLSAAHPLRIFDEPRQQVVHRMMEAHSLAQNCKLGHTVRPAVLLERTDCVPGHVVLDLVRVESLSLVAESVDHCDLGCCANGTLKIAIDFG